jgi:hypothetical protein
MLTGAPFHFKFAYQFADNCHLNSFLSLNVSGITSYCFPGQILLSNRRKTSFGIANGEKKFHIK